MKLAWPLILTGSLLAAGCASDADMQGSKVRETPTYTTGSNMPKRGEAPKDDAATKAADKLKESPIYVPPVPMPQGRGPG